MERKNEEEGSHSSRNKAKVEKHKGKKIISNRKREERALMWQGMGEGRVRESTN